ncbi:sulfite exporter TauE/SafE family protein [Desulfatitalea alkaliphila]|uniref:Probable membrane transporter protein n=1 Tax=Desulfatitalea alkaliphila TaxID=2929485 RepID=A0AA41R058_9BACT|nr:sulfite exporter TauE/SafE family protein [Desulfatitalea alkaliphila]MCJ8499657.1 sulfite exporter TauE/SafE family protein [Desulfatitalea alkaliphila]
MELIVVAGALVLASLLMGLTGFGFAIVAVSLISFVWPVRQIVPFLFVYNVVINLVLLAQLRNHVHPRRIAVQMAGFVPGALLGLYALIQLPDTLLKLVIGITLMGFALWSLARTDGVRGELHWAWNGSAGVVSGLLGGAIYMAGPPIIVLNALTHMDRFAFKADLQAFFLLSNLYLAVAYGSMGLFSWSLFRLNIYLAPLMLAGVAAGSLICRRISNQRFQGLAHLLLMVMGIILVWRELAT